MAVSKQGRNSFVAVSWQQHSLLPGHLAVFAPLAVLGFPQQVGIALGAGLGSEQNMSVVGRGP